MPDMNIDEQIAVEALIEATEMLCRSHEAYRVRNGEDRNSSDDIANAREAIAAVKALLAEEGCR